MKKIGLALFTLIVLASCKNDDNEDVTTGLNKDGSVETAVTVEHADAAHDILLTTHNVWIKGQTVKTVVYRDTIPSLGITTTEGENGEGETATLRVPKDYEIFITVK